MQELLSLVLAQLRNIWRFRWVALGIAWAIALIGWLYVYSLPDEFHSSARVHINTESAISPLLSGMAVTPDPQEQVNLLIRTVTSRPHLRDIARATGLDLQATSSGAEQAQISGLSNRLSVNNTGGGTDVYAIDYTSNSAETAQAVVQEVISIMTSINLAESTGNNDSQQAVSFLSNEVDKYREQLTETEQDLAEFKKNHPDMMPGTDDYVTRVQSLNSEIDNLENQLATARDRRDNIQRQLNNSGSGSSVQVSASESAQVQRLDQQIDNQDQQLSQLLMNYTSEHPDVIAARRQLEQLRERRSNTLQRLRSNPSEIEAPGSSGSGGNAASSQLVSQLNEARVQINTVQSTLQRRREQLSSLQAGAEQMNEAQAEFSELSRNYQVTRDQYEQLLSRLYSARLSTDVQKSSGGLDFRVIEPPEVPAQPSGPPRVLLMIVTLVFAIGAGAAFALFLAQLRPVFSSRGALTRSTGYPVLGSVSQAVTPTERARRRRSLAIYIGCSLSLVLGLALAIAIEPLATAVVPNVLSPAL